MQRLGSGVRELISLLAINTTDQPVVSHEFKDLFKIALYTMLSKGFAVHNLQPVKYNTNTTDQILLV